MGDFFADDRAAIARYKEERESFLRGLKKTGLLEKDNFLVKVAKVKSKEEQSSELKEGQIVFCVSDDEILVKIPAEKCLETAVEVKSQEKICEKPKPTISPSGESTAEAGIVKFSIPKADPIYRLITRVGNRKEPNFTWDEIEQLSQSPLLRSYFLNKGNGNTQTSSGLWQYVTNYFSSVVERGDPPILIREMEFGADEIVEVQVKSFFQEKIKNADKYFLPEFVSNLNALVLQEGHLEEFLKSENFAKITAHCKRGKKVTVHALMYEYVSWLLKENKISDAGLQKKFEKYKAQYGLIAYIERKIQRHLDVYYKDMPSKDAWEKLLKDYPALADRDVQKALSDRAIRISDIFPVRGWRKVARLARWFIEVKFGRFTDFGKTLSLLHCYRIILNKYVNTEANRLAISNAIKRYTKAYKRESLGDCFGIPLPIECFYRGEFGEIREGNFANWLKLYVKGSMRKFILSKVDSVEEGKKGEYETLRKFIDLSQSLDQSELSKELKELKNGYDLFLMTIANEAKLPDLSQRATDKFPVLIKKGNEIYIYGRKTNGTLGYTELDAHILKGIKFPTDTNEIKISKEQITKAVYDEITLKEGHSPQELLLTQFNDLNKEGEKRKLVEELSIWFELDAKSDLRNILKEDEIAKLKENLNEVDAKLDLKNLRDNLIKLPLKDVLLKLDAIKQKKEEQVLRELLRLSQLAGRIDVDIKLENLTYSQMVNLVVMYDLSSVIPVIGKWEYRIKRVIGGVLAFSKVISSAALCVTLLQGFLVALSGAALWAITLGGAACNGVAAMWTRGSKMLNLPVYANKVQVLKEDSWLSRRDIVAERSGFKRKSRCDSGRFCWLWKICYFFKLPNLYYLCKLYFKKPLLRLSVYVAAVAGGLTGFFGLSSGLTAVLGLVGLGAFCATPVGAGIIVGLAVFFSIAATVSYLAFQGADIEKNFDTFCKLFTDAWYESSDKWMAAGKIIGLSLIAGISTAVYFIVTFFTAGKGADILLGPNAYAKCLAASVTVVNTIVNMFSQVYKVCELIKNLSAYVRSGNVEACNIGDSEQVLKNAREMQRLQQCFSKAEKTSQKFSCLWKMTKLSTVMIGDVFSYAIAGGYMSADADAGNMGWGTIAKWFFVVSVVAVQAAFSIAFSWWPILKDPIKGAFTAAEKHKAATTVVSVLIPPIGLVMLTYSVLNTKRIGMHAEKHKVGAAIASFLFPPYGLLMLTYCLFNVRRIWRGIFSGSKAKDVGVDAFSEQNVSVASSSSFNVVNAQIGTGIAADNVMNGSRSPTPLSVDGDMNLSIVAERDPDTFAGDLRRAAVTPQPIQAHSGPSAPEKLPTPGVGKDNSPPLTPSLIRSAADSTMNGSRSLTPFFIDGGVTSIVAASIVDSRKVVGSYPGILGMMEGADAITRHRKSFTEVFNELLQKVGASGVSQGGHDTDLGECAAKVVCKAFERGGASDSPPANCLVSVPANGGVIEQTGNSCERQPSSITPVVSIFPVPVWQ